MTPDQQAEKLADRANRAVRMLALEALSRIVLRTPVDTGRARGNWLVGVGDPVRGYDPEGFDPAGTDTIQTGQAILNAAAPGEVLYITNSVPYIVPLEHGHSKQAPAGMVGITLAELQPVAAEVAVRIRQGVL
jgi:hypothetical protein